MVAKPAGFNKGESDILFDSKLLQDYNKFKVMRIREKTKEALLNVLARLIQIVVAMLIIGPFVSGVFNPRVFLVGFLLFFGFSGLLTLIGQSMKEEA